MSERFPRQFGKYVLLRSLARGGMGEIYLAGSGQGGGLDKLCVIKKVIANRSESAKTNRFLDEARVVLRLSHANLVSTFDAGEANGELYIAMEQVEGKDLREIWNRCVRTRTRIPLDVALIVAREVARALSYVHTYADLRLVHRDVAPPNILLSYFGEVKLTDFGLARSVLKTEHTTPGVVFGRASYLSPEQARGEVADARTDVYSLGIVTWELLTGQPYLQIAGLDPVSSLALVRHPNPEPPSARAPWIAAELDAIVMKALAPDRQLRFQSAEEFRRALSDVMTRVAPRADADRVADFLRSLYRDVMAEERHERDRFLSETLPSFRGESLPVDGTPATGVVPPTAVVGDEARAADADFANLADADQPIPGALVSGRQSESTLSSGDSTGASSPYDGPTLPGSVTAPGGEIAAEDRMAAANRESLHASAMRARADYRVRRLPDDRSGVDAPTNVWRVPRKPNEGAPRPNETFVGRVINQRYRIHRRIGEGGMGTVYAAEHVEIGKAVAVKILHRQYSGDEQLVERFRREARAASRVGHPNIIDVTDFGTTEEGCAFFVMELLDGMDLADVLAREEKLATERSVRIVVQVCRALHAAHNADIIHRDLKPENIYLVARHGEADFVKVLDFGIAQTLVGDSGRLTNPGMAMGTPEYMAPEQAMARPVDRRTDIYALGALLYEMLMGIAPYKAGPVDQILERKMQPLATLRTQRPEISPALDAVIRQALDPSPDRRHQTMAQFEYELTKTVWGRAQAVTEMLGLHMDSRTRSETPSPVTAPPEMLEPAVISPLSPLPSIAQLEAALEADLTPSPLEVSVFTKEISVAPIALSTGPSAFSAWPGTTTSLPPPSLSPSFAGRPAPTPSSLRTLSRSASVMSAVVSETVPNMRARTPVRLVLGLGALIAGGSAAAYSLNHGGSEMVLSLARRMSSPRTSSTPKIAIKAPVAAPAKILVSPTAPPPDVRSRSRLATQSSKQPSDTQRVPAPNPPVRSAPTLTGIVPPVADIRAAPASGPPSPAPVGTTSSDPSNASSRPPRPPEIVQTSALQRARDSLAAGLPNDAVSALRATLQRSPTREPERTIFVDALVAAGWQDVKIFRWQGASQKAREALAQEVGPSKNSQGAHALLGEALFAFRDFRGALDQFTAALAESPKDARLKRRVIRARRQLQDKSTAAVEPTAEQD